MVNRMEKPKYRVKLVVSNCYAFDYKSHMDGREMEEN